MTAPLPLTEAQMACLRLIQDLTDATGGVSPSIRQIGSRMGGRSAGHTHKLVSQLIEKGHVERVTYRGKPLGHGLRILHRLPPAPPQAVAELLAALALSRRSVDGSVHLVIPAELADRALKALATPIVGGDV